MQSARFTADTIYSQWTMFPGNFDPVAAGLTLVLSASGDFNANGELDVSDVNTVANKNSRGRRVARVVA